MCGHNSQILIVDDEPKIIDFLKAYFEVNNYQVYTAYNGYEALQKFKEFRPQFVILDLMLPDISGEMVCKRIREESDVPIIMLTAKTQEESFINGLKIGADDYITKPFRPKQLVAKVEAIMRRTKGKKALSDEDELIIRDEMMINNIAHEVRKNNIVVDLTPNEYNILLLLMKYPKKVFTRDELIFIALSEDYSSFDRMVDSYIKQLRQKIEENPRSPKYILTVHGVGYRFGGLHNEA